MYTIIPIVIMVVIAYFAITKQKSFKGKMKDVNLYGKESLEIAKTIIPNNEKITFISCGRNLDTEKKGFSRAAAHSSVTGSTTSNFKNYDYFIVAKTIKQIYFIPARIVGTRKLSLELNSKKSIEEYAREKVKQEFLKLHTSDYMPLIDIKFNYPNGSHSIQFSDHIEELKQYQR